MKNFTTTATKIDIEAGKASEGKIPSFKMTAYTGGLMRVRGYDDPVGVEVSGMEIDQKTPIRAEHEGFMPVGHTEKITAGADGIFAEGLISRENDYSKDIVESSRKGFPWQASIGASASEYVYVKAGQTATLNGKETEGPFYHILKSRLNEISFVERGADPNTLAVAANKPKENPNMDPKEDNKQTPPAPVAATQEPAPVTAKQEPQQGDDLAVIRAARAEQNRKNEINSIAAKTLEGGADIDAVEQILANALKDKSVNPTSFERDMILCQRRDGGFNIGTGKGAPEPKTIEAAVAMSAGLKDAEKAYDERTLNAAQDTFRRGLGLRELIDIYARRNGFSGQSSDIEGQLYAAFIPNGSQVRASGFSTNVIGGILSNIANKFIREAFMFVEQEWASIAAIANVRDFKTRTVYSLTGDLDFQRVSNAGEIAHGTVGEEVYTNKADTYGRMLAITRQDLINDDLDALSAVPRRLGRGAALKLNDVFWTEFLDDATFFNTDKSKNNYIDGAGSALSSAGLNKGVIAFNNQTDPDGKPLGSIPRKLIVPIALETTARELMNSQLIVSGSTGNNPNTNIWQNRFDIVASRYLSDATAWYLAADPADLPLIEVAFLNGQRMPTVETAQANFNTLGIQMRGVYDFGVKKQEYRAGIKSKGKA
jgi:hypothetical protein